jgi:hypothetical protein
MLDNEIVPGVPEGIRARWAKGRAYGYIEAAETSNEPSLLNPANPRARINLVLDAVLAPEFDNEEAQDRDDRYLGYIRIMTTKGRLLDLLGRDANLDAGGWVEVTLDKKEGHPRAWIWSLTDRGMVDFIATNVVKIRPLGLEIDLKAANSGSTIQALVRWCTISPRQGARPVPSNIGLPKDHGVRVVDVGQASLVAFHAYSDEAAPILGYYDAGAPVFFHNHTFPPYFPEPAKAPSTGFLVLSHWDYDHYGAALIRCTELTKLHWFAPDQKIGPVAAKLQAQLAAAGNLTFLTKPIETLGPGLDAYQGSGKASSRNNSGYAVRTMHPALLTGDVDYGFIAAAAKNGIDRVVIPHHGGGQDAPPKASGLAAVSHGDGNRYGHPRPAVITGHIGAGWGVMQTTNVMGKGRGDIWLY